MILQFLQDNRESHFSAKDIYEGLLKKQIIIGIASVYRNLETLCQFEIVRKYNFGNGEAVYQYNQGTESHCHLIDAADVQDVAVDKELEQELAKFKMKLEQKYCVQIADFELNFFVKK
jgi:Fe2+ or Zn2+ uptake regulation protein